MRTQHCFCDIPAKNAHHGSNYQKVPIMFKLSNILQNDQSVILKHTEVIKIKDNILKETREI